MGKGDRKTRRGKLYIGTYGVRRPKKGKKHVATSKPVIVKKEVKEPVKEVKEIKVVEKVEKKAAAPKVAKAAPATKEKKAAPAAAKEKSKKSK